MIEAKVVNRGNCMLCGKELTEDEGIFFCKKCRVKIRYENNKRKKELEDRFNRSVQNVIEAESDDKVSLCDSCVNYSCIFQTGIIRKKCDFYKSGRWIEERTYMECPNCHDIWHYEKNQTERFKFCPTCGKRGKK